MGFSSKYYEQAINDIKATAKRREQEYDYKLRELYKEIPELSLIDTQLQKNVCHKEYEHYRPSKHNRTQAIMLGIFLILLNLRSQNQIHLFEPLRSLIKLL